MRRAGPERAEEPRSGLRPVQIPPTGRGVPFPAPRPVPARARRTPRGPAPRAVRARPPEPVRAHLSPCAGAMAEQESLEFGKADFVLMDTVSMPEFMANLRLR